MTIDSMLNATAGFLAFTETDNGRGDQVKEYPTEPVAEKRCRCRPASNRERENAGRDEAVMTHTIYFEPLVPYITEAYPAPRRDDHVVVTHDDGVTPPTTYRLLSSMDPSDPTVFAQWRCEDLSKGR